MRKQFLFIALMSLVVTAFLAWLPFGLRIVGMAEEWRIMANYDSVINLGEAYNRLRPLQTIPLVVSYLIQPNSFEVMNVILFIALLVKGVALFLTLSLLFPKRPGMALLAALLFTYFPADEGIYVLRAMAHSVAVAGLMAGIYFFFASLYYRKIYYMILYVICTVMSLFIYEVGYPVILLVALLPYLMPDLRPRAHKMLALTIAILMGCGLFIVYTWISTPPTVASLYQSDIVEKNIFSRAFAAGATVSVARMYGEHFIFGWIKAIQQIPVSLNLTFLAAGMSLLSGAAIWYISPEEPFKERVSRRSLLMITAILLILMLAGFALFLPSGVRNDNWRVYLYTAAPAACLISMGFSYLVGRLPNSRIVFSVISVLILFLGYTKALEQHAHFEKNSQFILHTLDDILVQAPSFKKPVSLVILNVPEASDLHVDMFYHHNSVPGALQYIQHDPEEPVAKSADFCIQSVKWRSKTCDFGEEGIKVHFPDSDTLVSYESLLLFQYDEQGRLVLQTELPSSAPASARARYKPLELIGEKPPSERMTYLFK